MPAPQVIHELVKKFERNLAQYKSASYNETETRVEFLNPFWEALGWDVNNRQGYALNYREVIHEDSIRLKGVGNSNSKAPDYAFRIGENRKFFLEAKKPSVAIKTDVSPAYQLRCYGWSCGLPISVLSDFEEMAVYDCRIRPKISDPASVARIKYFTFREYIDRWDEIEEIFHRENILRGSFDRFVQSRKSKAGTSEVDDEFLREIEEWRVILAKDAAKNNPELDARALNFVVQRTIDRIVFLRMAEDRGIEPEEQLFRLFDGKKTDIYAHLLDIYRAADEKYNSGFFHFTNEPGETEPPDELTPKLNFSDRALTEILSRIYPPVSPYRFDVLPVEILGNVYERFLGKVIRITPSRQVKVEEKPEVKKANGVFYTPPYIVNYIVQNTVGRLCEGKTPKEVAKLKILDPACGSGSFLLGAYKFLMDWHLKYWLDEMARTGKIPQIPPAAGRQQKKSDPNTLCQSATGEWRLTLTERKRILLNNIYGVDLDAQAVEVTKLSLSLCVLEGFNDEALQSNLRLFYDRALPNLSENIRCGNSLIGPDFFAQGQGTLFDLEEQLTINAFDWRDPVHGFGTILKNGGFDAVIGNPPYVRMQVLQDGNPKQVDYFRKRYGKYVSDNFDIYILFITKALELLNSRGVSGYILPHKFFKGNAGEKIRQYLSGKSAVEYIVDFTTNQIFDKATTYTCLLFLSQIPVNKIFYKRFELGENFQDLTNITFQEYLPDTISAKDWIFVNSNVQNIINKICHQTFTFQQITQSIFKGSSTGNDKVYLVEVLQKGEKTSIVRSDFSEEPFEIENELLVPFLYGEDVRRYMKPIPTICLIAPYKFGTEKTELIPISELKKDYPLGYAYFMRVKKVLSQRKGNFTDETFYKYSAARNMTLYKRPKIMIPDMLVENRISYDFEGEFFHGAAIHSVVFNDLIGQTNELVYLAILNSKLFWFFISSTSTALRGNTYRLTPEFLNPFGFPDLRLPQFNTAPIVAAVTELLALNRRLQTETFFNPQERVVLERRAASLDLQIDDLVFDLYGLTSEERALCE